MEDGGQSLGQGQVDFIAEQIRVRSGRLFHTDAPCNTPAECERLCQIRSKTTRRNRSGNGQGVDRVRREIDAVRCKFKRSALGCIGGHTRPVRPDHHFMTIGENRLAGMDA